MEVVGKEIIYKSRDEPFFETEFEIQAGLGPIDSTKTGPN